MSNKEGSRIQFFSEVGSIIILGLSALWLYSQPDYEPLILFLSTFGAIFIQIYIRFRDGDVGTLFGKVLSPLIRWKDRTSPLAEISFDTLLNSKAINHKIKAWRIWDDEGPTQRVELKHRLTSGSYSTFDKLQGHHLKFETLDINKDSNPELLIRYATGAHTRVLKIFKVNASKRLELIPGAEIGSDWPEIKLKDQKSIPEIHSKNRNWNSENTMEPLTTIYKFSNGKFVKSKKV